MVIEAGSKLLQAAQVIRQTERLAPAAENVPVASALRRTEGKFQPVAKLRRETIVIEQRIVHIEQKYHRAGVQHGEVFSMSGSCQVSSPSTIFAAAAGPHVPGSYSMTGGLAVRMGSITCQAASTLSSWVNSARSPRMASPSRRSYGDFSRCELWRAINSTGSPRMSSPLRFTNAPVEITTSGLKRSRK